MFDHDIRALSVAIAYDGAVLGNLGYTWARPDYPITQPDTLFPVASVSKLFTCAAIDRLVSTGAVSFDAHAFPYLDIVAPTLMHVDPDMNNITILHLAMRQSGLRHDIEGDIRSLAKLFSMTSRPTIGQVPEYSYMSTLVARPGTGDNYSNPAFTVLGAIVGKASGVSLIDYLRRELLAPLGITDVHVGGTDASARRVDEVATYDAAGVSPSHLDTSENATANDAHGGNFALEADAAYDELTAQLQKIIDERLVLKRAMLDTVAAAFIGLVVEVFDAVRDVVSRRIDH